MTDENLTWDQAFSRALKIVENAFPGLEHKTFEKTTLRESLGRHIKQPRRLIEVARRIPDTFEQFGKTLPLASFWIKVHKETANSIPTALKGCKKCYKGAISYQRVVNGINYSASSLCSCQAGLIRQSQTERDLFVFEDNPRVAAAVQDGRIYFENGIAKVRATGEIVTFRRKAEKEPQPEPKPEPEEPEDIRDTIPEQEEIPF